MTAELSGSDGRAFADADLDPAAGLVDGERELEKFLVSVSVSVATRSGLPDVTRVMGMTRQLLSAGEWSLTVELLCDALLELDVPISRGEWGLLARLADEWEAPPGWERIAALVADE